MRKVVAVILLVLLMGTVASAEEAKNEDIVILYENDVHCAIDGYAKLAAMKKELAESYEYVGAVSVGDYIQGSSLGAVSQGEYIIDVMNLVGYDAVTLGNHEFDFRLQRLFELVEMMNTKPVCSNFQKIGEAETVFEPYSMVSYGEIDVAYIGITTPDTMTSSAPSQFMDEENNYIYTFHGIELYDTVQKYIDEAKLNGADYVIALSHLGTENVYEQWSAQTLVENTTGLDVVLDGHSHSVVESMTIMDESGEEVIITSTGTKFENIGKLTISEEGIQTELIPTESYENTDETVANRIAEIEAEYAEKGERKIGTSLVNLTTVDENGNRLIRTTETNMGDFCADAFRLVTGADIGFMNGGGIRADIAAGDVTFNDILSVFPWNNRVCVIEATGQQIVDMLELSARAYPEEDGTFQHVSGITFEFDGSIPSPVVLDENMVFVRVDGERRVSNVKVLNQETQKYEAIELDKIYALASHNYLLLEQGGGASMFRGAKVISDTGMLDVELLEAYIVEHFGGIIGEEYQTSQNRIVVLEETLPEEGVVESPITGDTRGSQMYWLLGLVVIVAMFIRTSLTTDNRGKHDK